MSEQSPYETLGVGENASFEEIQDAKRRLTQEHKNDIKVVETIEAAYDTIIMDRLRLRQEGKIKVPERIRFPEKSMSTNANLGQEKTPTSPEWLKHLLDNPSVPEILWPGALFLTLAIATVLVNSSDNSPLSLLLALGFGANIYFLNRKEKRFGRSFLLSFVGLCLGLALGYGMASLVVNSNNGIVFNQEQFTCLVTFCLFWLISSFLR